MNAEDYHPYLEHAYYWFPLVLYNAFCDKKFIDPLPTPQQLAVNMNLQPSKRTLKWLAAEIPQLANDPITRYHTRFWSEPLRHFFSDIDLADTSRDIHDTVFMNMRPPPHGWPARLGVI